MLGRLKVTLFAALVLRAMVRERTGSGVERVVPRHRCVVDRLGPEPDSQALERAERYPEREGYIAASLPDRRGDPYTITEAASEDLGYQPATSADALVEEEAWGLTRARVPLGRPRALSRGAGSRRIPRVARQERSAILFSGDSAAI